MPGRQTIHLYCMCWNDERMLPHFFRHYDPIVDRYFVFESGSTDRSMALLEKHGRVSVSDFDISGDSFVEAARQLCDTVWQNSLADWVIIVDIDEHLYHPNLPGYLERCSSQGVTAIEACGYEMVSDHFPSSASKPLCELVTNGVRSAGHDKLCILNPREVTATNYGSGRHEAQPTGEVVWPPCKEVLLLHYKQLGVDYAIARSAELGQRLRARDLEERWGVQWTWNAAEVAAKWQELQAAAGPVPGLGILRNMDPREYAQEERIAEESGLVDNKWYLATYPDVEAAGADPLSHYCIYGWKEGRQPNFYFDPQWYCTHYPALHTGGRNPLCDYVVRGEKEGAWPSPLFNTNWYRTQHELSVEESPLRHYLHWYASGLVSPLPEFDVVEYCHSHPDILAAGMDPFEQYYKRDVEAAGERAD